MSRKRQKCASVAFEIRPRQAGEFCPASTLSGSFSPASCSGSWLPCCEMTCGHRSWGMSPANRQKEIEAFGLTACEKLNLDNSHLTELVSDFSISRAFLWEGSPVWHLDWTPVRDLEAETPGEAMPRLLIDRDCVVIHVCSFVLLTFRVICYIEIDNKFSPCPLVYLCANPINLR